MKTCTTLDPCAFKSLGGTFAECSYEGYCDYQTPRDSRVFHAFPEFCCCPTSESDTAGNCNLCGKIKY